MISVGKRLAVSGISLALALILAGCSNDDTDDPYRKIEAFVSANPVGAASDHWIEMKNMDGAWEKTGLVFGYLDDFDECQKAIAGLKKVNYAREYRCVPANRGRLD